MKRFISFAFLTFCLMTLVSVRLLAQTDAKGLIDPCEWLQASTFIRFENIERVSSDASAGKTVNFRVRGNVVVNGKVMVPDGAAAIGKVKRVVPATYNEPAQVVLVVTHTRTADDQTIAIAGDEQTFIGDFKRQGMVVEQGQAFTGTVINSTKIQPRKI
jgi:hypothetical protein